MKSQESKGNDIQRRGIGLFVLLFVLIFGGGGLVLYLASGHKSAEQTETEEAESASQTEKTEPTESIFASEDAIEAYFRQKTIQKLKEEGRVQKDAQVFTALYKSGVTDEAEQTELWKMDVVALTEKAVEMYQQQIVLKAEEGQYALRDEVILDYPTSTTWKEALQCKMPYFASMSNGVETLGEALRGTAPSEELTKLFLNPVTSLTALGMLEGGESEWIPVSYDEAMVAYTFPDGQILHYLIFRIQGTESWLPAYCMEQYEWGQERIQQILAVRDKLEKVTVGMLSEETTWMKDITTGNTEEENTSTGFAILDRIKKEDVTLYGLCAAIGPEGMVLRVKDKVYPIYVHWDNMYRVIPTLWTGDFDGDGEREYAIGVVSKTGTGCQGCDLFLLEQAGDRMLVSKYDEELWIPKLNEEIAFEYSALENSLRLYNSREEMLGVYEVKEAGFRDLYFGDIQDYRILGDRIFLTADGGVLAGEIGYPQYETNIQVYCPVIYDGEGNFALGKAEGVIRELPAPESENQLLKEACTVSADVTQDGSADTIQILVSYQEGQEETDTAELVNQGEILVLRVLSKGAEQNVIWERTLASAHSGNGILYLVNRGGKQYLLDVKKGIWQGVGEYSYELFVLDEYGCKYMIERQTQRVDLNAGEAADMEGMLRFTEALQGLLKQGKLLALTDVDLEQGVRLFGQEEAGLEAREIWTEEILETVPGLREALDAI